MITFQLKQIDVPPGQRVIINNIPWQQFEDILKELGEHRGSLITYNKGILEIMTPLPEHEIIKGIISDLVKILLEELTIDCESFGSTTFKREDMEKGVEPDESFYIQNYQQMIGRDRINLSIDPPPDLVIEIDITSKTQLDIYEALKVPELWRFENNCLEVYILQEGKYIQSNVSPTFPNLPIIEVMNKYVKQARCEGRSKALRAFRQWIRE